MKLTQEDYNIFITGKTTLAEICFKYETPERSMRRQISRYKGGKRLFTAEDRERLRAELIQAVPRDPYYSTTATLARWEVKTITQALQLLKVSSMAELRFGPDGDTVKALLKKYKLRLFKGILYAPGNRGLYHDDRQMQVDMDALARDPKTWFKNNLDEINSVCYRQKQKKSDTKPLSRNTLRRFETATKTLELLALKYTVREIGKKLGTSKYVTTLRINPIEDLFTDEELEQLTKAGLI